MLALALGGTEESLGIYLCIVSYVARSINFYFPPLFLYGA
jgi:hypothetical protein